MTLLTGTSAAAGATASATAAAAATASATATAPAGVGQEVSVQEAVRVLAPYVRRAADGTFALDAPAALVAQLPAGSYASVLGSLSGVNALVRSGVLVPDSAGRLVPAGGIVQPRSGSDGFNCYWWGCELDIDSVTTSRVEGLLNAGAGAAAIGAALQAAGVITAGSALATAIVSGVLWMGAGVIQACANENGVSLYWAGIPGGPGMPWCTGQ
jgi:hypothetical protein